MKNTTRSPSQSKVGTMLSAIKELTRRLTTRRKPPMKLDELAYGTAIQTGMDLAELRERIEKLEKELEQLTKEE